MKHRGRDSLPGSVPWRVHQRWNYQAGGPAGGPSSGKRWVETASSARSPRTPRCEPGLSTPSLPQAPCSASNALFPGPVHKPLPGRESPRGALRIRPPPQQVSGPLGSGSGHLDQPGPAGRGGGTFSQWQPSWATSTQHRPTEGHLQAVPPPPRPWKEAPALLLLRLPGTSALRPRQCPQPALTMAPHLLCPGPSVPEKLSSWPTLSKAPSSRKPPCPLPAPLHVDKQLGLKLRLGGWAGACRTGQTLARPWGPGRLGEELPFVGGPCVSHSLPQHKCRKPPFCQALFSPTEGKPVTRRALFPGSCLPGGPAAVGRARSWGSWLRGFPSRPRGAWGLGTQDLVPPRPRATPARPSLCTPRSPR